MSLDINAWSRDELDIATQRLTTSARALGIAGLLPYIEAAEAARADLEAAQAHSGLATVEASQSSRAFVPSQTAAVDRAQSLLLYLRALAKDEVEGAALLLDLTERTWNVRDRRARGPALLAPLRDLVAVLTMANPSPAAARIADALDRLNAATEALGQSLDSRDGETRDQKQAQVDCKQCDRAARAALCALRRAVALQTGGEKSEGYLRWKAPVAYLGRPVRRLAQAAPAA